MILATCGVALSLSFILLVLFRYAIKYIIWIVMIGSIVALIACSIVSVTMYMKMNKSGEKTKSYALLGASCVLPFAAIILSIIICCCRDRIQLVVQLFKEASKTLADVPTLIIEPVLTFLAIICTCIIFILFAITIESSGKPTIHYHNGDYSKVTFDKNAMMSASRYVNVIGFMWFTSFLAGCQNLVIAGAVCQWFFARKESSPIIKSFGNLLRFHIGSVCLASLVLTVTKILRFIMHGINVKFAIRLLKFSSN